MINFGVSTTLTWDKDVYYAINAVGKSFFNFLEIRCEKGHFDFEDEQEIKKVKRVLKENRVKGSSIHPPKWVDIANKNEWTRMKSLREVEKTILVAKRLNIPRVILHPGQKNGSLEKVRESIQEILEFSQVWEVQPILENTFPGYFASRAEEIKNIVTEFDLPVCLDTSHAAAKGDNVEQFLKLLKNRITHLHLSDSNMKGKDDHLIPGEGKINWNPLVNFLSFFDGMAIFELHPVEKPDPILAKLNRIRINWQNKKINP